MRSFTEGREAADESFRSDRHRLTHFFWCDNHSSLDILYSFHDHLKVEKEWEIHSLHSDTSVDTRKDRKTSSSARPSQQLQYNVGIYDWWNEMASCRSTPLAGYGCFEDSCTFTRVLCELQHGTWQKDLYVYQCWMSMNTPDALIDSDDFMTNGKCHDQCSGYAFAVVQFKDCWCSNYAPGGASDASSCNVACPGYPFEKCGDKDQGLFGYVALGPAPAGTQGGSESSSPSQTADASSQPSVSIQFSMSTVATTIRAGSPYTTPSPIFLTQSLTIIIQNSSPDRSSVTVQDTVTATPSAQVSVISVV